MPTSAISKQQVLAALTATRPRNRPGPGHGEDEDGLAGLSMDELAVRAGVSRATLYRLFGSQQDLLHELGLQPPPTVRSRLLDTALELVSRHGLAELSMDELAAAAGVSRATLYRLFGSQQHLLHQLGLEPPPTVRSRILDAALDLVGRHGLAELSMDELAAAAGVSRATLYRLFPGKEALFAALVQRFSPFEPIAAVLEAAGDRPPAEVIPAVAQAMAAAMDGHMGLLLQLLFEFARDRHLDDGHRTNEGTVQGMRTLPLVSSYLAGQMAAGRLRRMDPDLAFQALAGPIVMHLLWRPKAASGVDGPLAVRAPVEEAVDELVGVWLRAMATDQQAAPEPPRPRRK